MKKKKTPPKAGRDQSGSTLLFVIAAITIFSAVAVGLMSMTTTSTYSQALADNQSKAM